MALDTFSLRCFLVVVETGSFTKAAEHLGRTQSAISQQIRKLEQLVDKPLLTRDKPFALTREGELFFDYAQRIFTLQRDLLDQLKEPELEGEVRFGIPEDVVSVYLSDFLADLVRLHPRISVNIECDLTINLYERFKRNEFDLVLLKMTHHDEFPHGIDIWSEKLVWVGDARHFESKNPVPLILSPRPCVYRACATQALDDLQMKWRLVFSSHSYAGRIAAVKAGLGVTVLPKNMVPAHLEIIKGNKKIPQLADSQVTLLKKKEAGPAVDSFEQFVLDELR